MLKPADIHRFSMRSDLKSNNVTVAKTEITYEVHRYDDLRNLVQRRKYLVKCTQRITVSSSCGYTFEPGTVREFNRYPVQLSTTTSIDTKKVQNLGIDIQGYSPKTLNASVSTSSSQSDNASTSASHSRDHTTGSSTAQTNSYGVNANIGMFGDQLTGGIGGNYEYATTNTDYHSDTSTAGTSAGHGHSSSGSSSMSIKDWGAYGIERLADASIQWMWNQEYPWNVLHLKGYKLNSKTDINLPKYIEDRLWNGCLSEPVIYPPSELSLFGVSFVTSVSYCVVPDSNSATLDVLVFNHDTQISLASHGLRAADEKDNFYAELASIDPAIDTVSSEPLQLDLLALNAITSLGGANGAETGFLAKDFVVAPTEGKPFKIESDANNLLVLGSKFDAPMTTGFKDGPATMTVYFKVLDTALDYTLAMKHFKTGTTDCVVKFAINDQSSDKITLTKTLTANSGDGGDSNFTRVRLRNKDLMFDEYYDYLKLGLNKIDITITPADGKTGNDATTGYKLMGLAID